MIPEFVKEKLVCPIGHAPLRFEDTYLECTKCRARFPMTREGYPNMVPEDAILPEGVKRIADLACSKK